MNLINIFVPTTLQNRALRICLNVALYTPLEILHRSAQIPLLQVRRVVHLRNVMFKMKSNVKHLNMRDAPVFELIIPTCEKYKNNVFYNGAVLWNNLSVETGNI